jgi:hypothetical protein
MSRYIEWVVFGPIYIHDIASSLSDLGSIRYLNLTKIRATKKMPTELSVHGGVSIISQIPAIRRRKITESLTGWYGLGWGELTDEGWGDAYFCKSSCDRDWRMQRKLERTSEMNVCISMSKETARVFVVRTSIDGDESDESGGRWKTIEARG